MSAGELILRTNTWLPARCVGWGLPGESLDAAFAFLRDDLRAQASAELEHISYEQLEAYIDDQLDLTEREILDSHTKICAECATICGTCRFQVQLDKAKVGFARNLSLTSRAMRGFGPPSGIKIQS